MKGGAIDFHQTIPPVGTEEVIHAATSGFPFEAKLAKLNSFQPHPVSAVLPLFAGGLPTSRQRRNSKSRDAQTTVQDYAAMVPRVVGRSRKDCREAYHNHSRHAGMVPNDGYINKIKSRLER